MSLSKKNLYKLNKLKNNKNLKWELQPGEGAYQKKI